MAGIDKSRQFVPLKIAVLTTPIRAKTTTTRPVRPWSSAFAQAGHAVAERAIVKDEVKAIRARVKRWIADKSIDVVITTGGTGFTGRYVTPEAVEPLFENAWTASPPCSCS